VRVVKGLRRILLLLLFFLLLGLAIGTAIRLKLERPERYIGSALAPHPLELLDAGPPVLQACQGEEQVG
jgi:hypothetical protein